MSESQTVAVLEWGTSKVKVLLAEIVDGNRLNIISKSSADTLTSVRKGDIIDVAKVYNKTRDAVINAENKASVKIKTVSLAISGTHIKTFRNLGSANISSPDGAVRREDVERAKEDAKRKTLESGRSYIQRICCGYYLDDKPCIDPVGKTGSKIDAEYLMIHGDNERLIEIANIVRSAGLEFDDIILSGIASAIAVTSAKQKTDGVLVADIGAGTTDYAFIKNGKVVAAGVIPVGGNHVTNDIALGLHLSPKTAENVKISCGKLLLTEDERKKNLLGNRRQTNRRQENPRRLRQQDCPRARDRASRNSARRRFRIPQRKRHCRGRSHGRSVEHRRAVRACRRDILAPVLARKILGQPAQPPAYAKLGNYSRRA